MVQKVLGSFISIVALVLMYLILHSDLDSFSLKSDCAPQKTPSQLFTSLISDDLKTLNETKELPPEWEDIAKIDIEMTSTLARALLGNSNPPIQTKKDGLYKLEMTFLDLPDDQNPGVIVQMSLFDIKTKNKIFEIGRTYTMNQLNNIQPKIKSSNKTK